MKILFFLFIFLIITSCKTNNGVYWCGDHPCINKKEREAYFKKTMTVEMKNIKDKNYKNNSGLEKIIEETKSKKKNFDKDEKNLIKQAKLEEKKLAKQIKKDEKKRIKEEKKLAKQIKNDEKKRIKEEKKSSNKKELLKKNIELEANMANAEIRLGKFTELVEKITKKNILRPYPEINDIPD